MQMSSFEAMRDLQIVFTDNHQQAFYQQAARWPRRSPGMDDLEEFRIFKGAIGAIAECAEFTAAEPSPGTGLYAAKRIYDIMSNVTKEDVAIFLGFVKAYPGNYIGKEWKISETFATWLINNAPIAE